MGRSQLARRSSRRLVDAAPRPPASAGRPAPHRGRARFLPRAPVAHAGAPFAAGVPAAAARRARARQSLRRTAGRAGRVGGTLPWSDRAAVGRGDPARRDPGRHAGRLVHRGLRLGHRRLERRTGPAAADAGAAWPARGSAHHRPLRTPTRLHGAQRRGRPAASARHAPARLPAPRPRGGQVRTTHLPARTRACFGAVGPHARSTARDERYGGEFRQFARRRGPRRKLVVGVARRQRSVGVRPANDAAAAAPGATAGGERFQSGEAGPRRSSVRPALGSGRLGAARHSTRSAQGTRNCGVSSNAASTAQTPCQAGNSELGTDSTRSSARTAASRSTSASMRSKKPGCP